MIGVIENMSWFTGDDGTRYELFGAGWWRGARRRARCAAAGRRSRSCPRSAKAATTVARSSSRDPDGEASQAFRAIAEQLDTELAPKRIYSPELRLN